MTFSVKAWWTPKSGYSPAEYEDCYAVGEAIDGAPFRIAIADGATGSTFSALWAQLLTADFASGRMTMETITARLAFLGRDWAKKAQSEPLPWYALEKVRRDGSHAALLGVRVSPESGSFHALAVGDCALFQLRPRPADAKNYALVAAFPYERSGDFGGAPILVPTQAAKHVNLPRHVMTHEGVVTAGDVLYLMSDALAAWFLGEIEARRTPWRWFDPLDLPDGDRLLSATVRDLRDTKRLTDDDVTVARVRVGE